MNSVKNVIVIALLVGVGYGVYLLVNGQPMTEVDVNFGEDGKAYTNEPFDPGSGKQRNSLDVSPKFDSSRQAMNNKFASDPLGIPKDDHAEHDHGKSSDGSGTKDNDPQNVSSDIHPLSHGGTATNPQGTFSEAWKTAERMVEEDKLDDALKTLSPWFAHPSLDRQDDQRLGAMLGKLAGSVIYSNRWHINKPHIVTAGETLTSIAESYPVEPELIAKINGIQINSTNPKLDLNDPQLLKPDQKLKVLANPFNATIHVRHRIVALSIAGRYAGLFHFKKGADFRPPVRTSTYLAWNFDNKDGQHWISLKPDTGNSNPGDANLGIHNKAPVGSRPLNEHRSIVLDIQDAEDLHYILTPGKSKVQIIP